MDTVKRGRRKVATGDCVSLPHTFFGKAYAEEFKASVGAEKVIGRVTNVNSNNDFSVLWDVDQEETNHNSIEKCSFEPNDTPLQTVTLQTNETEKYTSIITAEDFQTVDEGTSKDERYTSHNSDSDVEFDIHQFFDGEECVLIDGDTEVFEAKVIETVPGEVVHHHALADNQKKFLITSHTSNTASWVDYKEDQHGVGSFVVWDAGSTKTKDKGQGKRKLRDRSGEDYKEDTEEEDESSEDEYVKALMKVGKKCMGKKKGESKGGKKGDKKPKITSEKKIKNGKKRKQEEGHSEEEVETVNKSKRGRKTGKKEENKNKKDKKIEEQDEDHDEEEDNEQEKEEVNKNKRGRKTGKIKTTLKVKISGKKKVSESVSESDSDFVSESDDTESEEEVETEFRIGNGKKKKKFVEEEVWKKGGWKVNRRELAGGLKRKPQIHMPLVENASEIDFLMHFSPTDFIMKILSDMNDEGRLRSSSWQDVSYKEFICFLGIIYSMLVYDLSETDMYWWTQDRGPFKGMNYGKYMSKNRFNLIHKYFLDPSEELTSEEKDELIMLLVEATNRTFIDALTPGYILVLDESMVKSYHRGLKGKVKIIRKPRPIGNEFKNVCDGQTQIVLKLELYEGKDIMKEKDFVKDFGATVATSLRLTDPWKSSGRIVIGDAWFGSIKCAVQLWNINGLHSNLLVKNNHKMYPRSMLSDVTDRGTWRSATATIDDVPLLAVKFIDLKPKQFITTYNTDQPGPPRETKHHGLIPRPMVAFEYLTFADGIDRHNHFRTGGKGLEDVWRTKSPHVRQFAGIFSFVFTNAFLAYKYFKDKKASHLDFKIKLSRAMLKYDGDNKSTRSSNVHPSKPPAGAGVALHEIKPLPLNEKTKKPKQNNCFYCQHGRTPPRPRVKTSAKCVQCDIPLCSPLVRDCYTKHIVENIDRSMKRMYKK